MSVDMRPRPMIVAYRACQNLTTFTRGFESGKRETSAKYLLHTQSAPCTNKEQSSLVPAVRLLLVAEFVRKTFRQYPNVTSQNTTDVAR
jgi:hypothetical protein